MMYFLPLKNSSALLFVFIFIHYNNVLLIIPFPGCAYMDLGKC